MILVPAGVRVHIALRVTDMRKGLDGLAMLVQGVLKHPPTNCLLFRLSTELKFAVEVDKISYLIRTL